MVCIFLFSSVEIIEKKDSGTVKYIPALNFKGLSDSQDIIPFCISLITFFIVLYVINNVVIFNPTVEYDKIENEKRKIPRKAVIKNMRGMILGHIEIVETRDEDGKISVIFDKDKILAKTHLYHHKRGLVYTGYITFKINKNGKIIRLKCSPANNYLKKALKWKANF